MHTPQIFSRTSRCHCHNNRSSTGADARARRRAETRMAIATRRIAWFSDTMWFPSTRDSSETTVMVQLQQFAKLFDRQTSITNNTAHSKCVNRIVAWNGKNPASAGHHDMFSLTTIWKPAFSRARTASR